MKPDFSKVLQGFFATMLMDIAPNLAPGYATGSVGLMGMLMLMGADEYDRAAEVRVADNQDMRELFGEAASLVDDSDLKRRLGEAAGTADESLRVSALEVGNDRLKALLIDLQTYVEASRSAWAGDLEQRIWQVLIASCERRKLSFPVLG